MVVLVTPEKGQAVYIVHKLGLLAFLLIIAWNASVLAKPTLADVEAYGSLPKVRSLSISPSGEHTALIQQENGKDVFVVTRTGSKKAIAVTDLADISADYVYFITNDKVILSVSENRNIRGYIGKIDFSASYVYDIPTNEMTVLLNKTWGLHPAQIGLGKIVGFSKEGGHVFMPAHADEDNAPYHLYRVNIETGRGTVHAKGTMHTRDWFVDQDGNVLAREEYHHKRQLHRVYAYGDKNQKLIFEQKTPQPQISLHGISSDHLHLIYVQNGHFYKMNLKDGSAKKTNFGLEEYDIGYVKLDVHRRLVVIQYNGIHAFSELLDENLAASYRRLEATFQGSQVSFISSIQNGTQILALVSGNDSSGSYMLFDTQKVKIREIARKYPAINKENIGQISTIAYKARDGLRIPSVLTWPPNIKTKAQKKNLPLLVFPHGGPESSSGLYFDWWAQYFAQKGYLILQPNFRGSTGFGAEHIEAGYGEWGKAMQDDLSDGVAAMIKAGYVDPKRVCIMGASYGGYAALAGGAFTPDLYRCIISVAGVSDLEKMLFDDKKKFGKDHFVVRYWESSLGDQSANKNELAKLSPVNFVDSFKVPTLLVHGDSDLVVPIKQSQIMNRALKKANKNVFFVTLKGEDHSLSNSTTRLKMLREVDRFLQKYNPAKLN